MWRWGLLGYGGDGEWASLAGEGVEMVVITERKMPSLVGLVVGEWHCQGVDGHDGLAIPLRGLEM